jgi:hypothetical protein
VVGRCGEELGGVEDQVDRGNHAFVGAVMVVHLTFATLLAKAPRRDGTLGKTRLGPVAKALQEAPAA